MHISKVCSAYKSGPSDHYNDRKAFVFLVSTIDASTVLRIYIFEGDDNDFQTVVCSYRHLLLVSWLNDPYVSNPITTHRL